MAKRQFKSLAVAQGKDSWERIICLKEDHIAVTDGVQTSEYSYDQIKKVVEDAEYSSLLFDSNSGIRLAKNGFTVGSAEEVRPFIESKKVQKA